MILVRLNIHLDLLRDILRGDLPCGCICRQSVLADNPVLNIGPNQPIDRTCSPDLKLVLA